jgi:type IV secretory pathway TrbF-like protein
LDSASDALDAPWLRAGLAYNDTFLRLAAQVANWRLAAFVSFGIAAMAVVGLIYIGSQSKFVPYVEEVDKLGRVLAVKALTGDEAVIDPSRIVYREMFELIENLRTVTTDVGANNRNLTNGFARLSGAANGYARAEISKAKPNDVGQTKTVQVVVKTALRLTDKTWQVEWEERSYGLTGEFMYTEHWKATVGYLLSPQGTEEAIRQNPAGFIVTDISWQKVI